MFPGDLIMLLVTKFLTHPMLAITKEASKELCNRIESLLQESEPFIHEQIPASDVAQIMEILSKKKFIIRLVSMLIYPYLIKKGVSAADRFLKKLKLHKLKLKNAPQFKGRVKRYRER